MFSESLALVGLIYVNKTGADFFENFVEFISFVFILQALLENHCSKLICTHDHFTEDIVSHQVIK